MAQSNILNAADYADALLTTKRAKNATFWLLLLILLLQIGLFFMARYWKVMHQADDKAKMLIGFLEYVIGLTDFFGMMLVIFYAGILSLILKVLLIGRLLGVTRMTSALLWMGLLVLLLFPWQSILNSPTSNSDPISMSLGMKIPGVLYTWTELHHPQLGATFSNDIDLKLQVLRWSRFVAWPVVAILILFTAQAKSSRGLRQALGNDIVLPGINPPV